jgi:outer membrane protein TolC
MRFALLAQVHAKAAARRFVCGVCLGGLPWMALGCGSDGTPLAAVRRPDSATVAKGSGSGSDVKPVASTGVIQVAHQEELPPPNEATPPAECNRKLVPINLDTVLRLAEEQNPQLALDREKVYQATVDRAVADKAWIPDINVGVAWAHHEGGIQQPDGTLLVDSFGSMFAGALITGEFDIRKFTYQKVSAERDVWQRRGELSNATYEQLLDSATTYIDLLTARTAEGFARDIRSKYEMLNKSAHDLSEDVPAARPLADLTDSIIHSHDQAILKFRQQGDAASAKLAYLLGIDTHCLLVPVDDHLVTIDFVDASCPTEALVDRAVQNGPGVQETEALLAVIQNGIDKAQGPSKYMPVIDFGTFEGAFGAGPGDSLAWANRWDLGIAARWNLTEFLTAKDRIHSAMSKARQAQLTLDDIRGKLTLGVRESHDAILSGQGQIRNAYDAVQTGREAYKKSKQRFEDKPIGSNPADLLRDILVPLHNYETTLGAWLQAVSDYDKAQLQLRLLVGPAVGDGNCGADAAPGSCAKADARPKAASPATPATATLPPATKN